VRGNSSVTRVPTRLLTQGSQEQEVKLQDPMFTKFQDNFRTFCRFYEAQDTENARFSVLINVIHWIRSVLQS